MYTALIGNPVSQSTSPKLYTHIAEAFGVSAYDGHLRVRVENEKDLAAKLASFENLGFCGINITLPWKTKLFDLVDTISDRARQSGAINTIVFKDRKRHAHNTDIDGVIGAIENKLTSFDKIRSASILGAGGAARAAICAFTEKSIPCRVYAKDKTQKQALKDTFGDLVTLHPLEIDNNLDEMAQTDLIVNTTPVGMTPNTEQTLITTNQWEILARQNKDLYVLDAIFNPTQTVFIKGAQEHGLTTCPGTLWMINQGIEAFRLWTNERKTPDIDQNKLFETMCRVLEP